MRRRKEIGEGYASDAIPLGRRGRALTIASVLMLLLLGGSLLGVFYLGVERWRTTVNPNPMGIYSARFLLSALILSLLSIGAIFTLPAYVAEYRATEGATSRARLEDRWIGTMFVLGSAPFFFFGFIFTEYVGGLLFLGSAIALLAGIGLHAAAAWAPVDAL